LGGALASDPKGVQLSDETSRTQLAHGIVPGTSVVKSELT